jgi:hypothetical protein
VNRKLGLVIGNSAYRDSTLSRLATPDVDVGDLADVLLDAEIGGFDDVKVLVNASSNIVRRAISNFFASKDREDLLLLYFSGHGVLDMHGRLFLAVKDTERPLLRATAIPAAFITDEMNNSRSQRQLLILDCCHSGAFARGTKGSPGASVGTSAAFEGTGYGRVVLTATDATQYAWEGEQAIGEPVNSVFTHHLIGGLQSGAADANKDGLITIDELYDYAYGKVLKETPNQTPGKWTYREQGEIVIAQNPQRKPITILDEQLSSMDEEADQRLASLYTRGLSAYWLEEWDKAQFAFSAIVEMRPDYKDAALKLADARRQEKLKRLYEQGKRAGENRDLHAAIEAFKSLRSEAPDYKDSARLLAAAENEKRLEDLYGEAQQLYQAKQYQAVIKVFENLAAEQPGFQDPEGLLDKAKQEQQAIEKQRALEVAYSRALQELDAGRLEEAQRLLLQVQAMQPAFEDTERLLSRIETKIMPAETTGQERTALSGGPAAASGGINEIARLLRFETIHGWVGRVRAGRIEELPARGTRAGETAQTPALEKASVPALTDQSISKILLISAGFFVATFLVYLLGLPGSWLEAIDAAFGYTLDLERLGFALLSAVVGLIAGAILLSAMPLTGARLSWQRALVTLSGWMAGFALAGALAPMWAEISYPLGWLLAGSLGGALGGLLTGLVLRSASRPQGWAIIRLTMGGALGLGAAFLIAEQVLYPLSELIPDPIFWPLSRGIGNATAGVIIGWVILDERLVRNWQGIQWRTLLLGAAGFYLSSVALNLLFDSVELYKNSFFTYLVILGFIGSSSLAASSKAPKRIILFGILGAAGLAGGHLLWAPIVGVDHEFISPAFWGMGLGIALGLSTRRLPLALMLGLLCLSLFMISLQLFLPGLEEDSLSAVALMWGLNGAFLAFLHEFLIQPHFARRNSPL